MKNIMSNNKWYDDICEYYNISSEDALELGTRKVGRKPNLPASSTTHAVKDMTLEEIWSSKIRENEEQIFQFYKDQGAWSAFRQIVRHKDMRHVHLNLLSAIIRKTSSFCEYGCGVAPFTFTLLEEIDKNTNLDIFISDVECEHFTFGKWRLEKLIKRRGLNNVKIEAKTIYPGLLPQYSKKLDTVFIFEVLEHVPSPVATLENLSNQLNQYGMICENFIKHVHVENEQQGPDLLSAANERNRYYEQINSWFSLTEGRDYKDFPNETRIWSKK